MLTFSVNLLLKGLTANLKSGDLDGCIDTLVQVSKTILGMRKCLFYIVVCCKVWQKSCVQVTRYWNRISDYHIKNLFLNIRS